MASRRLMMWLLATMAFALLGLLGAVNFLADTSTMAPLAPSNASARSLLQANGGQARVRSIVLTVSIDDKRDDDEEDGEASGDVDEDLESSVASSSSYSSGNGSNSSDKEAGHDDVGRELSLNISSSLRLDQGSVPSSTARMMQDESSACNARQPYTANCFTLFGQGQERTIQRLAQAVGHLEIDEDHVSCSGVLLDGKSKTAMYFLTAARCVPNEKNVDRARIHFTGCAGTNTYKKLKLYALSRLLGYVVLRIETNPAELRTAYGFLHLRAARRVFGEKVFIAHYAKNSAAKRLTTTLDQDAIRIKPIEPTRGCADAPQSRVAYSAPLLDAMALGAPVISLADSAVVALHMCGDCGQSVVNSGLVSYSILVDLDNRALTIDGFTQHAQDEF